MLKSLVNARRFGQLYKFIRMTSDNDNEKTILIFMTGVYINRTITGPNQLLVEVIKDSCR